MTIANLALLKEAFISEQERMQAWMDEMKNHPVEKNEMKKKLNDAWISYFQQLKRLRISSRLTSALWRSRVR